MYGEVDSHISNVAYTVYIVYIFAANQHLVYVKLHILESENDLCPNLIS